MSSANNNNELIEGFIQFTIEVGSRRVKTHKTYRESLIPFSKFIEKRGKSLITVESCDIFAWRDDLVRRNYKSNTLQLRFVVVKRFYKWLHHCGLVANNPYPAFLTWEGEEDKPKLVPTPSDIFRIRMLNRSSSLEHASLFEVLLSSGLRENEARQLRACDVNFDAIPTDKETGSPSLYCGGTLSITRKEMVLKSSGRNTYISSIAAKLLKMMMAKNGIEIGSRVPLFPLGVNGIGKRLSVIGKVVYKGRDMTQNLAVKERDVRSAGFSDLDVDSLGVSESMKRLIRNRQKSESDLPDYAREQRLKEFPVEKKFQQLHAHALRHSFTCIMYFRNYHGEDSNMERLRQMLGHSSVRSTTIYLTNLDLIKSDSEWVRLMLGKPTDWIGAR